MPRNVELKAGLQDSNVTLERARALEDVHESVERHVDTYFAVPRGRLKLRRRYLPGAAGSLDREQRSELIPYHRADDSRARASDYRIVPCPADSRITEVLTLALGVDAVVAKTRRVFLHHGVRIHLDRVEGLGTFLEIEAIVDENCDEATAHARVARLREYFGVTDDEVLKASYRELIRERA